MTEGLILESLEALEAEAARFARSLTPKEDGASLVLLTGELGAGKTTFTQVVARTLGVLDHVTSPTFVLAKSYELPEGGSFRKLVHIDAYRLEGGKDLAPLGLNDLMQEPGTLVMLEWPEMVFDGLPSAVEGLTLSVLPDGTRSISYA